MADGFEHEPALSWWVSSVIATVLQCLQDFRFGMECPQSMDASLWIAACMRVLFDSLWRNLLLFVLYFESVSFVALRQLFRGDCFMWTVRKVDFMWTVLDLDCSVFRFRISIRIILVQVCLWIFKVLFGLGLDSHFLFSPGFCLDLFGLSLNAISQGVSMCFEVFQGVTTVFCCCFCQT